MKIIDLSEEYEKTFFVCLEDWSGEMKDAGDHKNRWYQRMKEKGVRVKLALDEDGVAAGMIQYMPIEQSFILGEDLYFITCIWIHGYKEGIGNYQKKGMGKALLDAAEKDVRSLGVKGIVAWGLSLPFWMKASWFKKHGYTRIDRQGVEELVWKPFGEGVQSPRWMKQQKELELVPGKVTVTAFLNGWCPAQNLIFERAKRAASEFGDAVIFQEIDTFDRSTMLEWGLVDGIYINGKKLTSGPPPSYEKLRKMIAKKVKKLPKS